MNGETQRAKIAQILLLLGSVLQLLQGFVAIGWSLYVVGYLGGAPTTSSWIGWMLLVLGALALAGGELGLRAFRLARLGQLRPAFLRAVLASLLPPLQLLTLIGAFLCRADPLGPSPSE